MVCLVRNLGISAQNTQISGCEGHRANRLAAGVCVCGISGSQLKTQIRGEAEPDDQRHRNDSQKLNPQTAQMREKKHFIEVAVPCYKEEPGVN